MKTDSENVRSPRDAGWVEAKEGGIKGGREREREGGGEERGGG